MNKKGKVIQIISNNKIDSYLISSWIREAIIQTGKDLIVLENPEYPKGLKGYFLSFKKNKPEDIFSILADSKGIKIGNIVSIDCEKFKIESFFYIEKKVRTNGS